MRHRKSVAKLNKKSGHRRAMLCNLVASLFKHERIKTTKAKAQAVRRLAEKMITRAKIDSVHNRRIVARHLKQRTTLSKLFKDIAPRFSERQGGYTRILKINPRINDAAEMVLLELVERKEKIKREKKKKEAVAKPTA